MKYFALLLWAAFAAHAQDYPVRAVRMLDSQAGQWKVAEILSGRPVGVDFDIPRVAVLMLDLVNPVSSFQPQ